MGELCVFWLVIFHRNPMPAKTSVISGVSVCLSMSESARTKYADPCLFC